MLQIPVTHHRSIKNNRRSLNPLKICRLDKPFRSKQRVGFIEQAGQLIGGILGVAVGALIGAVIVQYATMVLTKYRPAYWRAYRATLVGSISGYLGSMLAITALGLLGVVLGSDVQFLTLVLGAILQGYLYGLLNRVPGGKGIGFCKGLFVTLVQLVVGLFLVGLVIWISSLVVGAGS